MILDSRFTILRAGANLKLRVAAFGRKPHFNFWNIGALPRRRYNRSHLRIE
jgi:hypothetical protein